MALIEERAKELSIKVQQELEAMLRAALSKIDSEAAKIADEYRKRVNNALTKLSKLKQS